jgi:hypothetical protein
MLRLIVSQLVCLGVRHPHRTYGRIFITLSCGFADAERLVLARAVILEFESSGTQDRILLSLIRDSPNLVRSGSGLHYD